MPTTYVGIDLGTTNSAIATYDGSDLRVHKSPEQADVTPSAIFIGQRGNKFVGQQAYRDATLWPDNTAVLFKRLMGTNTRIKLAGAGVELTPVECSAEVLRYMYGNLPEEIRLASDSGTIITVPAAFNQMQMEATLEAAELAKIGRVQLLQEPVAAVMSVMREHQGDGRFLVYDLGGGTLDIAVAESIGGHVTLLSHGGIAMCGGRDIDRLIVERIVSPWLTSHFAISPTLMAHKSYGALNRHAAFAAERAKIELSARSEAVISLDEGQARVRDDNGRDIYLEIPLSRAVLDDLVSDLIRRSVEAAFTTLNKAGLAPQDVERIVFVGGPTQYKPLRDKIAAELGIAGRTEVNPMTAVAEGAALFAESVDWASTTRGRKAARGGMETGGKVPVSFGYVSRTPGLRAKCVVKLAADIEVGYEYQIDSLDSGWSSGRLSLRNGAVLDLPLAKPGTNTFKVFLFAPEGGALSLAQDRITISRTAATVDAVPASHSVGVEVLEKIGGETTLAYLVRAGDALPKKDRLVLRAAESLKAGSPSSLNFKLWEGEIAHPVSDNRFVGMVRVAGSDFDEGIIPAGAELLCDYEVVEAGNVTVTITVPCISASFHGSRNFYSHQDGQVDLADSGQRVQAAVEEVGSRVEALATRIQDPSLAEAASRLAAATTLTANDDPEANKQALDSVLDAKRLLAEVRRNNLAAIRKLDLDGAIEFFESVIREQARPSEITSYTALIASARRVIERETGEFEHYLAEMRDIHGTVLWRQDWFLVDRFKDLANAPHDFTDRAEFDRLVAAGRSAVQADDMDGLRSVVGHLYRLRVSLGSDDGMFDAPNVLRN